MTSRLARVLLPCSRKQSSQSLGCSATRIPYTRRLHDYNTKYADKIRKAAEERGKSVDELRADLRSQELERKKERLRVAAEVLSVSQGAPSASTSSPTGKKPTIASQRKDSSPVKPLSDIFNLARILEKPHTAEQISALWHTYHASRSKGTGRGYLCASVPVDAYLKMTTAGRTYPNFIVPLARDAPADAGTSEKAYEFHFLQWAFHSAPPVPTYESETALFPTGAAAELGKNPATSTLLFTPLQEYKLRQSFATPYLALTFYTELAHSHGIVLLRGELTPSAAAGAPATDQDGEIRYFLSQQDAQLLAVSVQRFYLWSDGEGAQARERLLRAFHEQPEEFKWEELLKHAEAV